MRADAALRVAGRDPSRAVTFGPPILLAPMEGITDPAFRDLVIDLGGVGGACTEFLRVSSAPLSAKAVRRALGQKSHACPVGVQLMAAEPRHVAASVRAAEEAGAAFVDLNFGCPAPVVFDKCAGSALLERPPALGAIVREAVAATGLPVTAKIRAGVADASRLAEIVGEIAAAGASLLTVHARLRTQAYSQAPTWAWIARARELLPGSIPLAGNGGVASRDDARRLVAETGCDAVMIGRAALANPFVFRELAGGPPGSAAEAASFALRYARAVAEARGERCAVSRLKQLVRWIGPPLFDGREDDRGTLLRAQDAAVIHAWLESRASAAPCVDWGPWCIGRSSPRASR